MISGYSWYENKEYQSENHYLMDAMGIQILYTRSANFYVKMDAARAVHRFKHDGEHRARVYASLEKYHKNLFYAPPFLHS
ncbi:hypothetical protein [Campylobacter jejuni]|uniref:hypothetical protein n=1 Tax=Campylobacter jejuni TaxID=197 RepID=UPI0020443A2C|nr:hypothetical protein [Campylobacter jejuni]